MKDKELLMTILIITLSVIIVATVLWRRDVVQAGPIKIEKAEYLIELIGCDGASLEQWYSRERPSSFSGVIEFTDGTGHNVRLTGTVVITEL